MVTVSAELPPTEAAAEQADQLVRQLVAAPQDVLQTPGSLLAAQTKAAELAPVCWTLALPQLAVAACSSEVQQQILSAVQAALPPGTSMDIAGIAPSSNGGVVVSLAGSAPAAELPSQQQSADLLQAALTGCGSLVVMPTATSIPPEQLATQAASDAAAAVEGAARGGRAAVGLTVAMPATSRESDLIAALHCLLPGAWGSGASDLLVVANVRSYSPRPVHQPSPAFPDVRLFLVL